MKNRRATLSFLSVALLSPLAACNAQQKSKGFLMEKEIILDVVLFNYWDRPIFDVCLNQIMIGGAGKYGGGGGIVSGVTIPLGPQTLAWRLDGPKGTARNGETVTARNSLVLTIDQFPSDAHYLGVHIYPDETAEFTFSQYLPDRSVKGKQIYEANGIRGR